MPALKSYRQTSSKRQKVQRTSLQVLSARRLVLVIMSLGVCAFILWGYFHAQTLLTSLIQRFELASAQLGFKLEDVIVEGRIRTNKAQILNVLGLKHGKPLFSISLFEAKTKLENLPWVKAACVERRLPNILYIRISEKEPIALWQDNSKTYLVDRDGELVETAEPHKYGNLLIITGFQAPYNLGKFIALLEKFPKIRSRITAATHLRSSRWDIKLEGKIDVKLPEKEVERALQYLCDLEQYHHLTDREIITIDMRLPEQLILRLTPEAAQKKNDTGKDA